MDKIITPQFLLKKLVNLTMTSCEMKQDAMLKSLVESISNEAKLILERGEQIIALKTEFQKRSKELKDYAKWKDFTKDNLPDFFEALLNIALQKDKSGNFLSYIINQKEHHSKFIRVEFLACPTAKMMAGATFRNRKTGKECDLAHLPKSIKKQFHTSLALHYSVYTSNYPIEENTDEIVIYRSDSEFTAAIIPEGQYLQLPIGKFVTPIAYRLALNSYISELRSAIDGLEKEIKKGVAKKKTVIVFKPSIHGLLPAINWKKQAQVDGETFSELKEALVHKGFIDEINGNTFKSAFKQTIAIRPAINWKGKQAVSNMLYFMYLVWVKGLAIEPKQKFSILTYCFKIRGAYMEPKPKQLGRFRSRYNQIKNIAEGKKGAEKSKDMEKMMDKMNAIIEIVS